MKKQKAVAFSNTNIELPPFKVLQIGISRVGTVIAIKYSKLISGR